jgi:hypothetical protein
LSGGNQYLRQRMRNQNILTAYPLRPASHLATWQKRPRLIVWIIIGRRQQVLVLEAAVADIAKFAADQT